MFSLSEVVLKKYGTVGLLRVLAAAILFDSFIGVQIVGHGSLLSLGLTSTDIWLTLFVAICVCLTMVVDYLLTFGTPKLRNGN